ncbi:MAG: hypothetical protein IH840_12665 [Candidatus Heimdallarchaeota archaeon]|nr:hypothetical protein [Candidatus Heimdallarchaeota archaeon]
MISNFKRFVENRSIDTIALNNTGTDAVMERTELIGDEGSAVTKWLAGNAVFQRNWPFSYLLSLEDKFLNGTDVTSDWSGAERFGVTTLPYNQTICGVSNTLGCGTQALGGAILGIPTASTQVALAKAFLLEIGSAPAQLQMLTAVGNLPALKSVYTDGSIPVAFEYAEDLFANVFSEVIPRPVHPDYAAMSSAIQPIFHDAIAGALSVDEAIVQMNLEVDLILEVASASVSIITTTIVSGGETIVTSVEVTITETEANSISLIIMSLSLVMVTVLLRMPRRRKYAKHVQ